MHSNISGGVGSGNTGVRSPELDQEPGAIGHCSSGLNLVDPLVKQHLIRHGGYQASIDSVTGQIVTTPSRKKPTETVREIVPGLKCA